MPMGQAACAGELVLGSYRRAALGLALLLALAISLALAQTGYELSWFAIGGGGGMQGGYTLSGTAGQAQAGALEGGGYTLQGGFWVGASERRIYVPLLQRQ